MLERHTQLRPAGHNLRLIRPDERPQNLHTRIGAQADGLRHGLHEILPAVRVDCMVPRMRRDHQRLRPAALRNARRNGQEHPVAEGHDRLRQVLRRVIGIRNGIRAAEQGTLEVRGQAGNINLPIRHPQGLRLPASTGQLTRGMVAAVVKRDSAEQLMVTVRPVQGGGGIQPPGEQNSSLHGSLTQDGSPGSAPPRWSTEYRLGNRSAPPPASSAAAPPPPGHPEYG